MFFCATKKHFFLDIRMKIYFCIEILSMKRYKSTIIKHPSDFKIVAIHADFSPYLLAWCLDDTFSLNFVCEPETFTINLSQNRISQHVEYHFQGSEQYTSMWILQNNGTLGKIYSGKPTPDYWILIEDEELMPNFELWLERLKSIDKIQTAYVFPPEKAIKFTWVNLLRHL